MKAKVMRAALLLVALLVVAAGCWNPTGGEPKVGPEAGPAEHGRVVLQFNDLRAVTMTPEISLEIDSYEVSFTRTDFETVPLTGVPGDATQTEPVSLLPGPWQVTVNAVNDEGKVIGFGETEVSVAARQTRTASVTIRSLTGEGTLSLTADASELDLLSPSISGTLISGATGEEIAVSMSLDGSPGSLEQSLEAGTYLLSLQLFESDTAIAGFVSAVLIVYEEITSAELVFRPVSGTVVAELVDEIIRPIAIALEGLQETLGPEESMTVSAQTAPAVDSYQWYLNGYPIDGENGQEITLGPGLHEREYLLTVVAQRGEIFSAQEGVFTVTALETYAVTYDPNGATSGTAPSEQMKIHGVDLTLAANSGNLALHSIVLYNFVGWNTASDGTGTDYAEGAIYSTDADLTLYANWEPLAIYYPITAVSAGGSHTMILDFGGTLLATGANPQGQIGDGTTDDKSTPVAVMSGVAAVSAGWLHTMILGTDGTLRATGYNYHGRLGDGTTENKSNPVEIVSGVAAVSAGGGHTITIDTGGTLWATGFNQWGQLGDGSTEDKHTPVEVMSDVSAASAGGEHTMILKTDGTLWATGRNQFGQLGDGTTEDSSTPVEIMSGVAAVSTYGYHTMILDDDGTLWATGLNSAGQLGDGTTEDSSTPVEIMNDVAAVSAGAGHTMILDTDGTLWATGSNSYGQLGDGTTENRISPIAVMSGVAVVSAGYSHTMILDTDGRLWATGRNDYGQLGDGTTEDRRSPVCVSWW